MQIWHHIAITVFTFIFMEAWAWLVHKYLLHGPLWFLHKSHHTPRKGWFEINDLVSIFYGVLAAGMVIYGIEYQSWTLGVGLGISIYGIFYFIFHDIIIHRRIKFKYHFKSAYVNRLIRAHKKHHKHMHRDDSEAFGFLYAHPRYEVKKTNQKV